MLCLLESRDHISVQPFNLSSAESRMLDDPYTTRSAIQAQQLASLISQYDDIPAASQASQSWESYLPTLKESQVLCARYFTGVDPHCHVIHKPTFELEMHSFFFAANFIQPASSFKALLLTIHLAAAISLSPVECQKQLFMSRDDLVAKLRTSTVKALTEANYMESTDLQTLQAFAIYLVSFVTVYSSALMTYIDTAMPGRNHKVFQCARWYTYTTC